VCARIIAALQQDGKRRWRAIVGMSSRDTALARRSLARDVRMLGERCEPHAENFDSIA